MLSFDTEARLDYDLVTFKKEEILKKKRVIALNKERIEYFIDSYEMRDMKGYEKYHQIRILIIYNISLDDYVRVYKSRVTVGTYEL